MNGAQKREGQLLFWIQKGDDHLLFLAKDFAWLTVSAVGHQLLHLSLQSRTIQPTSVSGQMHLGRMAHQFSALSDVKAKVKT